MPNWCSNNLTLEHDDPTMIERFINAYNHGHACQEFIPVPEDIGDGWYNFCVNNWGTKWDIGGDSHGLKATRVGNQVSCTFDSAWSPPIGLYEKLVELGYNLRATYWEPGMAFCGIWNNGIDNYVEYTSHDMIPVALWNDYNMGEFFEDDPIDKPIIDGRMNP
jgi:hypothetical protein